jgi:hypothetical protein
MTKSILLPEIKGVMIFSGYRGEGKTILAGHADFPQNIAFFDFDEGKAEGLHNQLKFGYYRAVEENQPLLRADMFLSEVEKMPRGKFTVAVLDNISPLEKALQAIVYRDAKKYAEIYGYTVGDIMKDSYGKARGIVNDLIGDAIAKPLHAKGVKLIVATSHAKATYNVPGKMTVQGRDRWQDLSILTLLLIKGDYPPVPSAIVQKEALGEIKPLELTDKQMQAVVRGEIASHTIVRRLPHRLPKADWQHIRWYLHNPANLENPAEGESLNLEEAEPFSERLSREQLAYKLQSLEQQATADKEVQEFELLVKQENIQIIKEYIANGLLNLPIPIKKAKLEQAIKAGELNYDGEITPGKIKEWSE